MAYTVKSSHNELHKKIIIALAHIRSVKPATVVKIKFLENLTENERKELLKYYDKMTDEQRKHPDK